MEALRYFPKGENKLDLIRFGDDDGDVDCHILAIIKMNDELCSDELVIQVYCAGLCGTDIHIVQVI